MENDSLYNKNSEMIEINRNMPANNNVERQKIVESLKDGIANGTFKPGQRLVELHLSKIFGVKRSKIREALRKLEQDGFVKIVPNVGAMVPEFSQKDIEHRYDLVCVLEGLAVRVITPFISAEQIESLEVFINKMEATDKSPLFHEYNMEFHSFITDLSENDHLIKLTQNLRFSLRYAALQSMSSPGQMKASIKEHRKIFEAIKEGKAVKAEQLTRNHLLRAKNRLIKYLNKSL